MSITKNLVSFSLMIFIFAVITILGFAVFMKQNPGPISSSGQTAVESNGTSASGGITAAQTAQHNNEGDCWLIVRGSVYNVTNFLPIHSGGAEQIIPYCGKDATTAFDTKNGRGSHRSGDLGFLQKYYVGNLSR